MVTSMHSGTWMTLSFMCILMFSVLVTNVSFNMTMLGHTQQRWLEITVQQGITVFPWTACWPYLHPSLACMVRAQDSSVLKGEWQQQIAQQEWQNRKQHKIPLQDISGSCIQNNGSHTHYWWNKNNAFDHVITLLRDEQTRTGAQRIKLLKFCWC